jgi:hypothetical protein
MRIGVNLIVMASCESAGREVGLAVDGTFAAHSALAPRLAEAGVPAVVAMPGKITMETVKQAFPVFFSELLKDGQIDRAMAAARGVVRDREDSWMEVRVLFRLIVTARGAETMKELSHVGVQVNPDEQSFADVERTRRYMETLFSPGEFHRKLASADHFLCSVMNAKTIPLKGSLNELEETASKAIASIDTMPVVRN